MHPYFRTLLALLISICVLPQNVPLRVQAQTDGIVMPMSELVPLPKSCGGGLPPEASIPVCCIFGYVFIDGEAVGGAKVTITSDHGSFELWTEEGPDSPQPYYRTSLSDAPLSVQAGESITIRAEYSGHQRVISHIALSGGQQVDVVLPSVGSLDYVFDRQYWQQSEAGQFSLPLDIAIDTTDTVYVVDQNNARIQVFRNNGQFLYEWGSLGQSPGQFSTPIGIAINQYGEVFVSDSSRRQIQKFTNLGTWNQNWNNTNQNTSSNNWAGLDADSQGNIYAADPVYSRIQHYSRTGQLLGQFGSLGSLNGQFYEPTGVAVDQSGAIYVTDIGNNRIQKFSRDGSFLYTWGSPGAGNAQFNTPRRITIDHQGNIYVADTQNHRIQKFSANGTWLLSWGREGTDNGAFHEPRGIAVDNQNNIYVADSRNNRIQKFSSDGEWLQTWGGAENIPGQLGQPRGVTVDRQGNMYVADTRNNRIQKYDSNGKVVATWGNRGSGNMQFDDPYAIVIDAQDNLYVADGNNKRIQKISSTGIWLANIGETEPGKLGFARSVAVSSAGAIYVVDIDNHCIQQFDQQGNYVRHWGTFGSAPGQFNQARGIAIDRYGYVYVADSDNNRIQKFTGDGVFVTSWGTQGSQPGQFNSPRAVFIDKDDYVYVADSANHRFQKFTTAGSFVAMWANFGSGDGELNMPSGIWLDTKGRIYVADTYNNRIQVFRTTTFSRPIATVVAIDQRSVEQGQPIHVVGMGSDSDSSPELVAYEWLLDDKTAPIATSARATLATTTWSPGRHTLSLRVRDTEGEYSALQSLTVDVSAAQMTQKQSWTFLLYLDGDAPNLAASLNRSSNQGALYRLEHSTPNQLVTVVALYDGPLSGGGDSFRYILRPDGTLTQDYLGEVNMGDPQTLIDFVRWGQQQAPSDYVYLALADHANALDGIAWDFSTSRTERLTNTEIRQALGSVTEQGAHPIDVLHLDGCLMGLVESAYQVRGLARYLVASENIGWSAFAYESYRASITATTSPQAFAIAIADRYAQRVGEANVPYTISALDLGQVDAVGQATNQLATELMRYALLGESQRTTLTDLRTQVQKLDSNASYTLQNEDEYVDLDHWASLVETGVPDAGVQSTATALRHALDPLVIGTHAASGSLVQITGVPDSGYNLAQAHGLGIYYPPRASVKTYQVYAQGELNFAVDTLWDEYLATGLASLPFDPSEPEPQPVEPLPLPDRQPADMSYHVALPVIIH